VGRVGNEGKVKEENKGDEKEEGRGGI